MTQVMIVEDDPMVRELNGQYLRRVLGTDLTLREFGDAQSALDAYQSQPADLILLDVYMPTLSGAEMLQEMTARNWHPQVIMLTAASDLGHVREALDYGVLDYLVKPFSFARFQTAIQRFQTVQKMTSGDGSVSQTDLDQLFVAETPAEATPEPTLPKGLSAYTLGRIRQQLQEMAQPFSNQEVAKVVKLSRISTKKYLDYLLAQGEVSGAVKYLKVGRPVTVYRLTDNEGPTQAPK
ncbi:response regulator [Lacticaseibacillus mingshuiensis]|uniref:Transcriptional regulatory protein n=1 Tax=Lacticaseibacillus mingshuiensis TaxID=2799574 RepID=A0ABW4CFG1_9LACO|nr:response regulator [Lacticaseibacillus mingshuiensis]